jgi:hypothetical protein
MMICKHLPPLLIFCLLTFVGRSQSDKNDHEYLHVFFSVFPLDAGDWSNIVYAPDGDPQSGLEKLVFNRLERSYYVEYKGPAPLRFYRKLNQENGGQSLQAVGIAPFGPGKLENEVILFFEPPKEPTGLCRIIVMPDNVETFPDESLVFFNTMDINLKGILGEEEIEIPPGLSRPIDVKPYLGNHVPILLAIEHQGDLHLVLRNKISFFPDRKTLLILRTPSRPGSMRIRTQRLTEFTGKISPEK